MTASYVQQKCVNAIKELVRAEYHQVTIINFTSDRPTELTPHTRRRKMSIWIDEPTASFIRSRVQITDTSYLCVSGAQARSPISFPVRVNSFLKRKGQRRLSVPVHFGFLTTWPTVCTMDITFIIIIIIIIYIKDWTSLIRSVARVTTVLANVSSVFQMFSFLVFCSDMISCLVAFFASVNASSVCIHLSCLVCL